MARIQYDIWSSYPPALAQAGQGSVRVHAGTISKLMVGKTPIPHDQPLPASTSVAQFRWHTPQVQVFQPQTRTVAGSNGKTYVVKTTPSGKEECSCPGYSYRRTCKHVR